MTNSEHPGAGVDLETLASIDNAIWGLRDEWVTSGVIDVGTMGMRAIEVHAVDDSESEPTPVLTIYSDLDVMLDDCYQESLLRIMPILDIIRHHVNPPSGDLRERIRQAVDAHLVAGRGSEVETITDAVMAEVERNANG